jgi:uncharacterized SAM-binding protein YcdF (DUF218 family)
VPPSPLRSGGSRRRVLLIAAVAIAAGSAWGLYHLGAFLYDEQPLQRADTIFVFAGTRMERSLEAVDLYLAGYAGTIVITQPLPDSGVLALERRGIAFPSDAELSRDAMMKLGVPSAAILVPAKWHDSTADEAHTLRQLTTARGWRRIIVVTSKFHTRRAGVAVRRALDGTGVEIVLRGSRYDQADPAHWWRTRRDVRWATLESQKLVAYWLGLGM